METDKAAAERGDGGYGKRRTLRLASRSSDAIPGVRLQSIIRSRLRGMHLLLHPDRHIHTRTMVYWRLFSLSAEE